MATLPTGTLTLLFSDIEGSTALLHRLGPRWGDALSAQRAILRAAFAAHDGIEMGTEGDSFFVVFRSARQALDAAITGQRKLQQHVWPDDVAVRVRMGIHTGEPQRHEDGYIGEDVHRAARIGSTASGAQIVISAATRRLIHDLPGASMRDLGHHRLKDLAGGEQLFDVVVPGLIDEFPPLRSLGRVATLPMWTTPLVGRDRELHAVVELAALPGARLVTLTGPGGSGKTRLATAAAALLQPSYADGAYFVGLSAATDAATMWLTIAEALDLGGSDDDVAAQVTSRLRERTVLLVLDNLEQIADGALVVGALLEAALGVEVMASSRRPLLLIGEHEFPVAPLALPPESSDFEEVVQAAAVSLFTQLARLARPAFEVTHDNYAAVATLCRRLDGLPLALELAAAQARLLSPAAMLSRIDGTLGTAFAAADRPRRQRTLDDIIGWSYDLLDEPDRAVFRRIGVFERSAALDAIAAVAGVDGLDILDVVSRLVNASVVQVDEGTDGEPRIFMLATIRAFARARLDDCGEGLHARMRHLTWCADVVERTVPLLPGALRTVALDRLGAIDDDIRAALRFALDPALPPDADRLAAAQQLLITATTRYWHAFGSAAEARQWQERALAVADDSDSEAQIGLLYGLGVSMLLQGALPSSIELLTRSLDMSRRVDEPDWQARILNTLAVAQRQDGNFSESMALVEASLAIAQRTGNDDIEAKALGNLAVLYHDLGDFEQAASAAEKSMRVNSARGDDWAIAIDRVNYTAAILRSQNAAAAAARLAEWMPAMLAFADTELMTDVIEVGGAIAAELGRAGVAARLLGAADARRADAGMARTTAEAGRVDRWVATARQLISADEWRDAYAAGVAVDPASSHADICSLADPAVGH